MENWMNKMVEYDKRMGFPDFDWTPQKEIDYAKEKESTKTK